MSYKRYLTATILSTGLVTLIGCTSGSQSGNVPAGTQSEAETAAMSGNTAAQGGTGSGQQGGGSVNAQDRTFVTTAASSGLMEVETGRLASEKGASAEVKSFGQQMVTDHTRANERLMTLARNKGMTPPAQMNAQHRQQTQRLSGLSGAEFDRAYITQMVQAHQQDVALFEQQSRNGGDPDLKAFATETLPTLRQHLQMAQNMASGGGMGSGNH